MLFIFILAFHDPCSGRAKPNKKARVTKPAGDPIVNEPEQQIPAPETSVPQLEEPVLDIPPVIPDPSIEHTNNDPLNSEPSSPLKAAKTHADDVMITGAGFTESGRPTVLAKHSAKEEHIERRKVRFGVANYSQLSISKVFSGYLNQVHTSRDLEIDMVKQMHKNMRYEFLSLISYVYPASPQVYCVW